MFDREINLSSMSFVLMITMIEYIVVRAKQSPHSTLNKLRNIHRQRSRATKGGKATR